MQPPSEFHIVRVAELGPAPQAAGQAAHRAQNAPPFDYGLEALSGNRIRGAGFFMPVPQGGKASFRSTGWHFHDCELQVFMVLEGSVDILLHEGTPHRLSAGDIGALVGGVAHCAENPSPDYSVWELTVPGGFDTVPCAQTPKGASTAGRILRKLDDVKTDSAGWIVQRYELPPTRDDRFGFVRLGTGSGSFTVAPAVGELVTVLVMRGSCGITPANGARTQLHRFDVVYVPSGTTADLAQASADFEAVQLTLPA